MPVLNVDLMGLLVEVLIWEPEYIGDVGHTAVRLNNIIYGYYPTDIDGDGAYTKVDLDNSPGSLHTDSLAEFHSNYYDNTIEVIRLETDNTKEAKLNLYFKELNNKPGVYSLFSSQCTTRARDGLLKSGYPAGSFSIAPYELYQYYSTRYYNSILNNYFYNISGVESMITKKAQNIW